MFCGHIFCRICLVYWIVRDRICPPKSKAILFIAHPDDDALFFLSFVKEQKPYIVLLFTGWSLIRLFDYFKVMRHYGVRFRAYDTVSAGAYADPLRRLVVERHVSDCLALGEFELCATHNAMGEYGHSSHRLVHEAVVKMVHGKMPILCPIVEAQIAEHPLNEVLYHEKEQIFKRLYTTEAWALTQYSLWAKNEKLVVCNR